jgi:hypothetical protein
MLALTDAQLRIVMAAASRLPTKKRGAFLESVAARDSGGDRSAYGVGAIEYHFKTAAALANGYSVTS